jgi:hypothetical protein
VAGYSPSPLIKKLGVTEGSVVLLLNPPHDLHLDLPGNATIRRQLRGKADVAIVFVTRVSDLTKRFEKLADSIYPSGGLWIAWPKRSSRVQTDVTDHVVRRLSLAHGLVDNKICAIDDTWTALRVVWRRENRM